MEVKLKESMYSNEEYTVKELLFDNTLCLALGVWQFDNGEYLTIYSTIEDVEAVLSFDTDSSASGDFWRAVTDGVPVYSLPKIQGGKVININA